MVQRIACMSMPRFPAGVTLTLALQRILWFFYFFPRSEAGMSAPDAGRIRRNRVRTLPEPVGEHCSALDMVLY